MRTFIILSLAATLMTGCNMTKRDWGTLGGAVAGGVIAPAVFGNSFAYTIIGGAAVGAWAGSYVGNNMDSYDRGRVGYTLNKAPDKQPYQFMRDDSQSSLTVTPIRTYYQGEQLCRDFELQDQKGGKTVYEKGAACRQGNNWQIRA